MPDKNISPEKRLLKMIEGQKLAAMQFKPLQLGSRYLSWSSIRGRAAFLWDRIQKYKKSIRTAGIGGDLRGVNTALQAAIAVVAIWLVISSTLAFRSVMQRSVVELQPVPASAYAATPDPGSLIRPLPEYLSRVAARDVFTLADAVKEQPTAFREQTESERIKSLTAHLKLVGISWSDSPDAIIEDTKAQRSYFVKEGAFIDEIKVFKVLKDRVVLKYMGEEVDLR